MLPDYAGACILAIPKLIAAIFEERPAMGLLPAALTAGVRTVVFVLADGLGYQVLSRWLDAAPQSALSQCVASGVMTKLVSVVPSTTAAALTTYSTGFSPQEHGMLGYRMFLREVGMVANMITFSPSGGREFHGPYLNPDTFLSVPSLYQRLARGGVASVAMTWRTYQNSALSRMLYRGAEVRSFHAAHDAFCLLRHALESRPDGRSYYHLYWDELDVVQHRYGPHSDYCEAAIDGLSYCIEQQLMGPVARQPDILYLLCADHGHIQTDDVHSVNLRAHPDLMRLLLAPPCGDERLPYLYCRPDSVDACRDYVATHFAHCADLVLGAHALQQGWFGEGALHPEALSRVGHFLLVPRGNWKFSYPWKPDKEPDFIGKHGGLSADEMEVPLLAWRWQ